MEGAEIVTEQFVPMGPAASQVAIKQTGTNGGGYMGVNPPTPLENPNNFTNIIEMLSLLLIPAALCFTFGRAVKKQTAGVLPSLWPCFSAWQSPWGRWQSLNRQGRLSCSKTAAWICPPPPGGRQHGGQGEPVRHRRLPSTWAVCTTAASNGSVNSMHDSYTPWAAWFPWC